MSDVLQRNTGAQTTFKALSREAKAVFTEAGLAIECTVPWEEAAELAENIKAWGLTIE